MTDYIEMTSGENSEIHWIEQDGKTYGVVTAFVVLDKDGQKYEEFLYDLVDTDQSYEESANMIDLSDGRTMYANSFGVYFK